MHTDAPRPPRPQTPAPPRPAAVPFGAAPPRSVRTDLEGGYTLSTMPPGACCAWGQHAVFSPEDRIVWKQDLPPAGGDAAGPALPAAHEALAEAWRAGEIDPAGWTPAAGEARPHPLDYYLGMAYPVTLTPHREGGYALSFPDLPGCWGDAPRLGDVPAMAEEARRLWLLSAWDAGMPLPPPGAGARARARVPA